jgi:DeoR family transcriptional regulator, aga operon transcriptional repressor
MLRTERHERLLEHVSAKGSIDVNELSQLLAVSCATVRRDLQYLSELNLLRRTHGGAVIGGIGIEVPLHRRTERLRPEKRAIAKAAAELVPAGAVVGLTGGTTTTEVARLLVERGPLTVVTNAVNIAAELVLHKGINLVVIGGNARSESYELIGPIAEKTLADHHTDMTFLGVDGISAAHGCTTHDQLEAATDSAFVRSSSRIIVVADHTKVGKVTFAKMCPLTDVNDLITDGGVPDDHLVSISEAGVTVTTV